MKQMFLTSRGKGRRLRRRSGQGSESGYTLTELLIVIAMLGLMLAISFPNMMRWIDRWRIDAAARAVSLQISLAKLKAVSRHERCKITLVKAGQSYKDSNGYVTTFSMKFDQFVIEGEALDEKPANDPATLVYIVRPHVEILDTILSPPKLDTNGGPMVDAPNTSSTSVTFEPNGQASMITSNVPNIEYQTVFMVYLTNNSGEYTALEVRHGGRIVVLHYVLLPTPHWREGFA